MKDIKKYNPKRIIKESKKIRDEAFSFLSEYLKELLYDKIEFEKPDIILTIHSEKEHFLKCFRGFDITSASDMMAFFDYNVIVIDYMFFLAVLLTYARKFGFKAIIRHGMTHEVAELLVYQIWDKQEETTPLLFTSKNYSLEDCIKSQFQDIKRHNIVECLTRECLSFYGAKKALEFSDYLIEDARRSGRLDFEVVWKDLSEEDLKKMLNNPISKITTEIEKETLDIITETWKEVSQFTNETSLIVDSLFGENFEKIEENILHYVVWNAINLRDLGRLEAAYKYANLAAERSNDPYFILLRDYLKYEMKRCRVRESLNNNVKKSMKIKNVNELNWDVVKRHVINYLKDFPVPKIYTLEFILYG